MTLRSLFAFIVAIAASTSLCAAESPNIADPILAEATNLTGTAMFVDSGSPGMLLGVVRGDRTLVLG